MAIRKRKPVLVLLHAFPLSSAQWRAQKRELGSRYRVLTPDLPGFGRNASKPATSIQAMARAVAFQLNDLHIQDPVFLAGLSMGGYVALEFARLYPDRVKALGLWATRAAADSPEQKKKRFENIRLIRQKGVEPLVDAMLPKLLGQTTLRRRPAIVRSVRRQMKAAQHAGVIGALRAMAGRRDQTNFLAVFRKPVLVIAGQEDAVIPFEEMQSMQKLPRKAVFHVLPNAGHLLNLESPVKFQAIVVRFLASLPA